MVDCNVKYMQDIVYRLQHAEPPVWYSSILKQKCNILIVNIIYMVMIWSLVYSCIV